MTVLTRRSPIVRAYLWCSRRWTFLPLLFHSLKKPPSPYSVKAPLSLKSFFFVRDVGAILHTQTYPAVTRITARGYQPSWQTLFRRPLCKRHQVSPLSSRQRRPANKHGSTSPHRSPPSFRAPSCSYAYIPRYASSAVWTWLIVRAPTLGILTERGSPLTDGCRSCRVIICELASGNPKN